MKWTRIDIPFQMLCVSCGVLSLVFANGAGSYIFQLMDSFAGNYTLLIIAFCEVSARTLESFPTVSKNLK